MEHLFPSAFRVERLRLLDTEGGVAVTDYAQAVDDDPALDAMLQYLKGRLDMTFVRPGKDIIAAPEAGKAPDRVGILFVSSIAPIRAGDRIVAIPNERGLIVVPGTFEIKVMPDVVIDYANPHHIEVQVIETVQRLTDLNWPGEAPDSEDTLEPPLDDEELEEPEP